MDSFDLRARHLGAITLAEPELCCVDAAPGDCAAYEAAMAWYRLQCAHQAGIRELNGLIARHDTREGSNCRCKNVVESRRVRGLLVSAFDRTERLLDDLDDRVQSAADRERAP